MYIVTASFSHLHPLSSVLSPSLPSMFVRFQNSGPVIIFLTVHSLACTAIAWDNEVQLIQRQLM